MRKLAPSGSHAKTASKGQGSDAGETRSLSLTKPTSSGARAPWQRATGDPRPVPRCSPSRDSPPPRGCHPLGLLGLGHRGGAGKTRLASTPLVLARRARRGSGLRAPRGCRGQPGTPSCSQLRRRPRPDRRAVAPGPARRGCSGQGSCTLMPGPSVR